MRRDGLAGLVARLRALFRDRRGNVLILFGFSLVPLTFATGMGIDYARAMRLQTKLNAAADAAALAAVSKTTMSYNTTIAYYAAQQMFIAQAQPLLSQGLVMNFADPAQLTITVPADTQTATGVTRKVTVSYVGKSTNAFASLLGMRTLTVKGTSASTASTAPNIDFYVMMDTSPSMLLPATSAGLATMVSATNGCAFACHQTGSTSDNYSIARQNSLVLRTDLVTSAVQDLTGTAQKVMQNNNAVYRMGLEDFDYTYRTIWPTSKNGNYWVDSNLSTVNSHVADATVLSYCQNNYRVCGTEDDDTATSFTSAMNGINGIMPTPGNGTNAQGDTPQIVMFIITDGMRDEIVGSTRTMGPITTSLCDTIKNRGIRIAILNTQYLPDSASDPWSIQNVKTPFLSPTDTITPALQSCASSGLFYQVTTNDDVSSALSTLFQQAVASAHLVR